MPQRPTENLVEWNEHSELAERLFKWNELASAKSKMCVDEPLSAHTSLRIGGPAKYWIEVGSSQDLRSLLAALGKEPCHVVGLGSNTLFPDRGIDGVVLRLVKDLANWTVTVDENDDSQSRVEVGAGAINAHLVRGLLKAGLVGAEFLVLIPGTFGGAVALNAGTKDAELKEILTSVQLAIPDFESKCWRLEEREARELALRYRYAELPQGSLVIGGTIVVKRGDVEAARQHVKEDKDRRNKTQPYRLASVGSTFANPPGDYAGRLIEAAGLKGKAVGGARISELHANFFINEKDATAEDFLSLMALARQRVRRDFGVELRPEVRFVGFDGRARMRDLEKEWEDKDV